MRVCMHDMYVCMYACMHVCMYICVCLFTYKTIWQEKLPLSWLVTWITYSLVSTALFGKSLSRARALSLCDFLRIYTTNLILSLSRARALSLSANVHTLRHSIIDECVTDFWDPARHCRKQHGARLCNGSLPIPTLSDSGFWNIPQQIPSASPSPCICTVGLVSSSFSHIYMHI